MISMSVDTPIKAISVNELERKGKYLQGILDDINSLKDRVATLEKKAGIH